MFMETGTTSEVCSEVVKAHTIFEKSPAQHSADLRMLEENPEFQSLFTDKDVECIRVYGCADEAPSHEEVQYYWTKRHLAKENACVLVTTRRSGGSESAGVKEEKKLLLESKPALYHYFEEIWRLHNRHTVQNLTLPYVFMLLPCRLPDCPHPRCLQSNSDSDAFDTWFPDGLELTYFPIPIIDSARPWGGPCQQCSGICTGHYLKPEDHLTHFRAKGKTDMQSKPASVVIREAQKEAQKRNHVLTEEEITGLARQTLLSVEEVTIWLDHLRCY